MTEAIAYPFLCPASGTISAEPWRIEYEDGETDLGEVVAHWDYTTDLVLIRTLTLDTNQLLRDCGLHDETGIIISVELTTGDLGIRQSVWHEETSISSRESPVEHLIRLELSGHALQGRLELSTGITLLRGKPESILSPTMPGSRLWDDRQTSRLEGGGGRIPMEASNFTTLDSRLARAPWMFHVETTDPAASFLGHVQVRLNSNRTDILDAVRRREGAVLERMTNDLASHLVARIIDEEDFTGETEDYEIGSLGRTAAMWLESAFPGQELEMIRSMRLQSPARFEAMLSSVFGGHYGD